MKRREWSGKRLLTLILALALAMSSFNVPVRASEAQTETVWEEKKEEQTEPVEQEEPEKEEPTEPANPEEPEKELRKLTIHCEVRRVSPPRPYPHQRIRKKCMRGLR